jgi:MFS family permease
MLIIIWTVSLAAFLQGHVQSSINAGSLFAETVGITQPRLINLTASESNVTFGFVQNAINGINNGTYKDTYLDDFIPQNGTYNGTDPADTTPLGLNMTGLGATSIAKWQLGGMNAIPFLTAAFPGAPLSLPVNYCFGRRGALGISALLIIASSLGSAFASTWQQVLGARIVGGIGESYLGSGSGYAPLESRLTHPLQPWESRLSVPLSSPPRRPWATGEALPS